MPKIHKTPHHIHNQSKFKTFGNASTDGITLDIKDIDKYPEDIVEKAIQLKANNQTKDDKGKVTNLLSDMTYLNYAQRFKNRELSIELAMVAKSMANSCPVDSEWAQFTYEEILEMEDSGCVIPNEVLAWAHAQQDSDVTSYIIVSDSNENIDELTSEEGKASDSEALLREKLNQYIVNAEKSIEQTNEQLDVFKDSLKNAKEIKKRKGLFFKAKLKDIEDMNEEWKKLDKKNEEGKLTKFEKMRYKHLSKKIKNSNAKVAEDFKSTSSELDAFLDNIEGLNKKVQENDGLSQEIINTSKNLNKIEKNLSENQKTHDIAGFHAGNGTLAETAFGVDDDNLEKAAQETIKDIDSVDTEVDNNVTNKKTVKVEDFAQEYVEAAEKVEQLVNVDDSKNDDKIQDSQDQDKNAEDNTVNSEAAKEDSKENKEIKTDISLKFSYENAKNSASISKAIHAQLKQSEAKTKQEEKALSKAEKVSKTNMKKLSKEAKEAEQKKEANEVKKSVLMDELTAMSEEKAEQVEMKIRVKESKVQASQQAEAPAADDSENTAVETQKPVNNEDGNIEIEDNSDEQNQAVDEIAKIDEEDDKTSNKLGKSISEVVKNNSKKEKLTKSLNDKHTDLNVSSKEAQQVGAKTVIVGAGTIYNGVKHTIQGVQDCTIGSALMGNPFTHFQGVIKFTMGVLTLVKAALEETHGLDAAVSGATVLIESGKADEIVQDSEQDEKEATQTLKEDASEIKDANKIAGIKDKDGQISNEQNSQNKDATDEISQETDTEVGAVKDIDTNIDEETPVEYEQETSKVMTDDEAEEDASSATLGLVNVTQQDLSNNVEKANHSAKLAKKRSVVEDKSADENSRAFSASSNTSVNNSVETDDKNDRKLTRFNNDSIIESKKRLRRVNAVSASAKK